MSLKTMPHDAAQRLRFTVSANRPRGDDTPHNDGVAGSSPAPATWYTTT
jgi:hypothetical protein